MPLAHFVAIMLPTSLVMGFALATVGFTCWNLSVPLLLNLFSFHIFDALFLTVLMDLTGSLVLVFLYSRKGRVDFGFVARFAPPCAAIAFTSAKVGEQVLLRHQKLLKGTVGYIPFLFFVAFFFKGIRSLSEPAADEPMAVATLAGGNGLARGSDLSSSHPPAGHSPRGPRPGQDVEQAATGPPASKGDDLEHISGVWTSEMASPLHTWMVQTMHAIFRSPILEVEHRRTSPAGVRVKLATCFLVICACGVIGGILYFGGGVIFVTLILTLFYSDDIPLVTGTGCALMTSVCIGLLCSFIRRDVALLPDLPVYAGVVLPAVATGTMASSYIMLYLSRTSVLLLVSFVALIMGVLITFQHQIFSWAEVGLEQ